MGNWYIDRKYRMAEKWQTNGRNKGEIYEIMIL